MGRKTHPRIQSLKGLLIASVLRLLGWLPLPLGHGLARVLGRLLWWIPNPMRRVTRINLALCFPHCCPHRRARLGRRALQETLKSAVDMAHAWHRPEQMVARIHPGRGEHEALRKTLERGQPVLLLAPHLGFWEGVNLWFGCHHELHALYMPSPLPAVDQLIRNGREHFDSSLYPATPRGVARLVRSLRGGGRIAGILPDQVPERNAGRFVPFFGRPAATMTLAGRLAQQSGARAFMVYARRIPGRREFELVLRDPDPPFMDADPKRSLEGLNASIEALIMEAPEQYLWSYRRFRRRPEGEPNPYR